MVEDLAFDILYVEVCHCVSTETFKKNVSKIGEIKGFKGMQKYIRNVVVTATKNPDNKLIGSVQIPLKVIITSNLLFFSIWN